MARAATAAYFASTVLPRLNKESWPQAANGVSFCAGGRVIHNGQGFKVLYMF